MLSATPCFAQRPGWTNAMPQKTLQQFADNLMADANATLMRFLGLQVKGCEDARQLLKQLKQGFAARPQATPQALQVGLRFLQQADLRAAVKNLRVPLQWLLGGRDTLVPASLQNALQQLDVDIPVTLLADAGHVPFLSHPLACLQVLEQLTIQTRVAAV